MSRRRRSGVLDKRPEMKTPAKAWRTATYDKTIRALGVLWRGIDGLGRCLFHDRISVGPRGGQRRQLPPPSKPTPSMTLSLYVCIICLLKEVQVIQFKSLFRYFPKKRLWAVLLGSMGVGLNLEFRVRSMRVGRVLLLSKWVNLFIKLVYVLPIPFFHIGIYRPR